MLLVLACARLVSGPAAETAEIDDTGGIPAPPEGGTTLLSAPLEIPPYSDDMICTFGTWTGGDVGVVSYRSWQSDPHHHHAMLMRLGPDADSRTFPEDGVAVPCEYPLDSLFQNVGERGEGLPAGMAMKLPDGERWVIQSHYVNTTGDTLHAQDAILLGLVPAAEVETWAAVFNFALSSVEVPPGGGSTAFDCTFAEDFTLLSVMGHMHEYGAAFSLSRGEELVYAIDDWEPEYRDDPQYRFFELGEYTMPAGTLVTTQCTWDNPNDEPLQFPEEMCATVGVGYPSENPLACNQSG